VVSDVVGEGSYGTVFRGNDLVTGAPVAVKHQRKDFLSDRDLRCAYNEIRMLRSLEHPNIIPVYEAVEDDQSLLLIMKLADGGDLLQHVNSKGLLSEHQARPLMIQIIRGVLFAHNNGVIHRDLKLENILLNATHDHAWVADWGFAGIWSSDKKQKDSVGSIHYSCPQILKDDLYIGPEVDVWSLGVMLFAMVCGSLPFNGKTPKEVKKAVLRSHYQLPFFLSNECGSLLRAMLNPDPTLRISTANVLDHPWFQIRRHSMPKSLSAGSTNIGIPAESHSPRPESGGRTPGRAEDRVRSEVVTLHSC